MNIRIIKAIVVGTIALFFTLIAFNNIIDFESNRIFIVRVLTLDTIQNDAIAWRAIHNPHFQLVIYWLFILWEMFTACLCWVGAYRLLRYRNADPQAFARIKLLALVGLLCGFLQYMVGFVDIGSEWFYLWQSELREVQTKAILFSLLIMACAIFVASSTNE